jgi:hypothetical protein
MNGEYQQVAFGYFDILGYSAALRAKCGDKPDFLLELLGTVDFSTHTGLDPVPLEVRIISDSIALWSTVVDHGLLRIINIAALVQRALLQKGFLVRGAITIGKHYSSRITGRDFPTGAAVETNDEVIVSPVLVTCVELEKTAQEPVILIDDGTDLSKSILLRSKAFLNRLISTHKRHVIVDGYFFSTELDAITNRMDPHVLEGTTAERVGLANTQQALRQLTQDRETIVSSLSTADERVRDKWAFIAERYNKLLDLVVFIDQSSPGIPLPIPDVGTTGGLVS